MEAPWIHRLLCYYGGKFVHSFYSAIHVDGQEHVPAHGPLIVVSSHHNQIVDICVLSHDFPYQRPHSYWAKRSLFRNPVFRYILLNSGNIPVDRKQNDNQTLLRGSFEVLKSGEALALFPEGTSYTEPRILQVKDGASWAALEYAKWRKTNDARPAVIVPVGMVYTDKSQYRSAVVKRYGPSINITQLAKQFETEGREKDAVKALTNLIEQRIVELTVNAADWDTYHVALLARHILWTDDARVPLHHFVHISQTLADLFSSKDLPVDLTDARRRLVAYFALLEHVGTSHAVLSSIFPLSAASTTPSKARATLALLSAALSALVHLPFFALPLALNLPAYLLAIRGGKMAGDEVEARAQNKIVFGVLAQVAMQGALTVLLARATPLGWLRGALITAAGAWLHKRLIDGNYTRWKRLVLAVRVFRAACAPSRAVPAARLAPYLVPYTPPPNPYVKSLLPPPPPAPPRPRTPARYTLVPALFRARVLAVQALDKLLSDLESKAREGPVSVAASPHMARAYGGGHGMDVQVQVNETPEGVAMLELATARRDAGEVLAFLKAHGAVIPRAATAQ